MDWGRRESLPSEIEKFISQPAMIVIISIEIDTSMVASWVAP